MAEPLMSAVDATRAFGDVTAVDGVSLDVHPGEIVGLLGANGAGKTTLIRMILGLIEPTSGAVSLFGEPPSRRTRERLGYVPQGLGLWEDLTVAENLDFISGAYGAPVPELPEALGGAAGRLVRGVGLGLQRQAAFVAALGHGPELLVLDEPTSGVAPLARARLWDVIHETAGGGVGVLVTTHYMQEAQQCDRLVLMSRGVAVAHGTEDDVLGDTQVLEIEAGSWTEAFAALDGAGLVVSLAGTRVRVIDASRAQVEDALADATVDADVREVRPTLEEAMVARERGSGRIES